MYTLHSGLVFGNHETDNMHMYQPALSSPLPFTPVEA